MTQKKSLWLIMLIFVPILSLASINHDKNSYLKHHSLSKIEGGTGKLNFSLDYMHMNMRGLLDGTDSVSNSQVFSQGFMASPEAMNIDMAMFKLMWMASMRWRFMITAPYESKHMELMTQMGQEFFTHSKGLGDVTFDGSYGLIQSPERRLVLSLGLNTPTGAINQKDMTPMGVEILPYPMQLGSGTYNPVFGILLQQHIKNWILGVNASSLVRLGRNYRHYRLGNVWRLNLSLTQQTRSWLQTMVALDSSYTGKIKGQDPDINPMATPTAVPSYQGGEVINALIGFKLFGHTGIYQHQQLSITFGAPLYQNLNGPQMRARWLASVNWVIGFA